MRRAGLRRAAVGIAGGVSAKQRALRADADEQGA